MYFDSYKINVYTFIERLFNKLEILGTPKKLIKSFCSAIKKEIKISLQDYLPQKKRLRLGTKNDTHLYKAKTKNHITMHTKKTQQKEGNDSVLLFLENMVKGLKNCKIIDKKSIKNLYNIGKIRKGNEIRLHQYRSVFSINEWRNLNGSTRHKNLTVWSPNAQTIMLSIGSKEDKELSNLQLLTKGFEQIAERFNALESLIIAGLLKKKGANVEFGIDVLNSEQEIREIGFEFLPKTYNIYQMKFWFDNSRKDGKIELDISLNYDLNNLINCFKLIEELKIYNNLYEKGIIPIEPFSLENINAEKGFSYETKRCYKNRDFEDLVNIQAVQYINRIVKNI